MTTFETFDLAEVRDFAADLDARMTRCDNGEGLECANLDGTLMYHAALCCEFREGVRQWGRAVFAGHVAFDPEVERVLLDEGKRLYSRAVEMRAYGETAEVQCFTLEGLTSLGAALWNLQHLLEKWVTPKLAVGPSARQGLIHASATPEEVEEIQQRIEALPPLPADWQPADLRQQKQLKRLRRK